MCRHRYRYMSVAFRSPRHASVNSLSGSTCSFRSSELSARPGRRHKCPSHCRSTADWTGHDRDDRARCSGSPARRERTSAIPKHPPPMQMMLFRPSESLSIFNVICDFLSSTVTRGRKERTTRKLVKSLRLTRNWLPSFQHLPNCRQSVAAPAGRHAQLTRLQARRRRAIRREGVCRNHNEFATYQNCS